MERKIDVYLKKWQSDLLRKPLLLYGPRQIGKTFTVLNFGHDNYKNVVYYNCFCNPELSDILKKEKAPDKIILHLSLLANETILKRDTLIVFDNLNDIDIAKGIKILSMDKDYHVIAISSNKNNINEFKGEEFITKGMNEMDFEEFLWARGEKKLADLIRTCYIKHKTCSFHKVALNYFYEYLKTGGLPEIVAAYCNGEDAIKIDVLKTKVIDSYQKEIALNTNLIDISRGIEVLSSMPIQLKEDNKKFQYGRMGFGKRAKEYESAINYLVNNQIVYRSYKIRTIKSPLSSCRQMDSFKLYYTDDGVLYSMLHLSDAKLQKDDSMKETLYENHIAKTLMEAGYSLYYYQSSGKAEVNFVIQNRMGEVIPMEITIRPMSKAKSLSVFMKKFTVKEGYRITENNFAVKKDVRYIPIYAIYCLNDQKI